MKTDQEEANVEDDHAYGAATALALSTAPSFAKELKSIGVSLGSMGNPFFVALSKGAEFEARKTNPNVKITTVGFEYDLGKQVTQIDNFIAVSVDLILLNPGDPKAIGPADQEGAGGGHRRRRGRHRGRRRRCHRDHEQRAGRMRSHASTSSTNWGARVTSSSRTGRRSRP